MRQGECFGEIALLDETPRTATISTRTDCVRGIGRTALGLAMDRNPDTLPHPSWLDLLQVLLTLTRDAFDSFMALAPQKLMEMKRIAAERNAATRQITAEARALPTSAPGPGLRWLATSAPAQARPGPDVGSLVAHAGEPHDVAENAVERRAMACGRL
jgi:hypothetical protein